MSLSTNFPNQFPTLLLDFANAQRLDPRITFTRVSPATYYDGVTTALAEQNFFLFSQVFSGGGWNARSIFTGGTTTAPDGTNTALIFGASVITDVHYYNYVTSGFLANTVYTVSVFYKQNTLRYATLGLNDISVAGTWTAAGFDLQTGTIVSSGAVGAGATFSGASITAVGNSWYRCTVTGSLNTTNVQAIFSPSTTGVSDFRASTTYTGDGTSTIFMWGAQLEQRNAATAYTVTTTATITNYIPVLLTAPAGTARFDHNPVTAASLGLLIEEARTNLLLRSDDFATTWSTSNASITVNSNVAPDGTLTADTLVENTATSSHAVQQFTTTSYASGTAYTLSVYAKPAGRSWLWIFFPSAAFTTSTGAYFNVSTGVVGTLGTGATATITAVGNGWYRCAVTRTATATAAGNTGFGATTSDAVNNYTGDGYSGLFLWGAQLEAGLFPTTYIATAGTVQTRNVDIAEMTGTNFSNWFNADQGTLYTDASTFQFSGYPGVASLYASINNAMSVGKFSTNRSWANNLTNSVLQANFDSVSYGTGTKSALAYQANNMAFSAGSDAQTDTNCLIPVVNTLRIGRGYASDFLNGYLSKIAYYDARLTNAQLQSLTRS